MPQRLSFSRVVCDGDEATNLASAAQEQASCCVKPVDDKLQCAQSTHSNSSANSSANHETTAPQLVNNSVDHSICLTLQANENVELNERKAMVTLSLHRRFQLVLLCIPAIPSQLAWAVSEALLIPYLLTLNVSETKANLVWFVPPIIALLIQPVFGRISDVKKRRKPFIVLFQAGIVIGLSLMAFSQEILKAFEIDGVIEENKVPTANAALLSVIFTGSILVESSIDMLSIPTRALLNDQTKTIAEREVANSIFYTVNSASEFIGLAMCFIRWNQVFPSHAIDTDLAATFLACVCAIVVMMLYTVFVLPEAKNDRRFTINMQSGRYISQQQQQQQQGNTSSVSTVWSRYITSFTSFRLLPVHLRFVWLCNFSWWLGVTQISFWWTTWTATVVYNAHPDDEVRFLEGMRFGVVTLIIHAAVAFTASLAVTAVNKRFGVLNVYHCVAVVFAVLTVLLWFAPVREYCIVYMIVSAMSYPILSTNGYLMIEEFLSTQQSAEQGRMATLPTVAEPDDVENESQSDEAEENEVTVADEDIESCSPNGAVNLMTPKSGVHALNISIASPTLTASTSPMSSGFPSPISPTRQPLTYQSTEDSEKSKIYKQHQHRQYTHSQQLHIEMISEEQVEQKQTRRQSDLAVSKASDSTLSSTSTSKRAQLFAVLNLTQSLSQVISATLGGFIISASGSITIVFLLTGILAALLHVACAVLKKTSASLVAQYATAESHVQSTFATTRVTLNESSQSMEVSALVGRQVDENLVKKWQSG